jgi:methyl acetate hydrolase
VCREGIRWTGRHRRGALRARILVGRRQPAAPVSDPREAVDAVLRDAVAAGEVPGVVAMATDGGEIVYAGAFGSRELGGTQPMTLDTVFRIESMTKPVTAVACLQLVEQGRIGLDDDVGAILPALASPLVLEGFDGGRPVLRAARGIVTLRRLLTHTAGYAYEMWNEQLRAYIEHTGVPRSQTFARVEDRLPLVADPGERWEYGVGFEWAGKLLEALTGEPLERCLERAVFAPLGMASTGYAPTADRRARLAGMHQRQPDGRLEARIHEPPTDGFLGGGGLLSTAGDYMRFLRMLLNSGELDGVRLLRPETVAGMGENHIGDLPVRPMPSAQPDQTYEADFLPGIGKAWGLSFLINTDAVPGGRAAGSLCWAGMRNTYFWLDPSTGLAGTILTQIMPFADPIVLLLYEAFERAVYRLRADLSAARAGRRYDASTPSALA